MEGAGMGEERGSAFGVHKREGKERGLVDLGERKSSSPSTR